MCLFPSYMFLSLALLFNSCALHHRLLIILKFFHVQERQDDKQEKDHHLTFLSDGESQITGDLSQCDGDRDETQKCRFNEKISLKDESESPQVKYLERHQEIEYVFKRYDKSQSAWCVEEQRSV